MSGGVIYLIECSASDKVYVGSARNQRVRKGCHFHQLRKGTHHSVHLQRSYDKHGRDAFSFRVVETVKDENFLRAREQFWIWRFEGRLFNCTLTVSGGPVGYKASAERRAAQSKAMMGNSYSRGVACSPEMREFRRKKAAGNSYRSGILHDDETKARISASVSLSYAEGRKSVAEGQSAALLNGHAAYVEKLKAGLVRHPRHKPERINAICVMYEAIGPKRTAWEFGITASSVSELVKKYRPEIMKRRRK